MKIGIDLDGTILTCKQKQMSLLGTILKYYNLEIDLELFWNLKRNGLSNNDILSKFTKNHDIIYKICKLWILKIESFPWLLFDKVIDGALDKINQWIKDEHTIHLISARNNSLIAYNQLLLNRIDKNFHTIHFVSPLIKNSKSLIFKKINVECYIGDTENDVLNANEVGIKAFSVLTGMRNLDFFKRMDIENLYNSISDIII